MGAWKLTAFDKAGSQIDQRRGLDPAQINRLQIMLAHEQAEIQHFEATPEDFADLPDAIFDTTVKEFRR